ncbi:uncharacterized protein LOC120158501 isoform X4 [Hibiscus syriacus]|uniref:uncharacterized protein LOC120158501 isoform X4 n=1 Tax=Hibiscus syriacus TaxID=106335 RepID=UPI0019230858|nr:uncharacterized protein LOC120158501 isoform X4 [Hibiscus syriacus]
MQNTTWFEETLAPLFPVTSRDLDSDDGHPHNKPLKGSPTPQPWTPMTQTDSKSSVEEDSTVLSIGKADQGVKDGGFVGSYKVQE